MFPIEDLRQAVETTKRILTREKLDSVMYGSAGLLVLFYLSLSRGIVSCIYIYLLFILSAQ